MYIIKNILLIMKLCISDAILYVKSNFEINFTYVQFSDGNISEMAEEINVNFYAFLRFLPRKLAGGNIPLKLSPKTLFLT